MANSRKFSASIVFHQIKIYWISLWLWLFCCVVVATSYSIYKKSLDYSITVRIFWLSSLQTYPTHFKRRKAIVNCNTIYQHIVIKFNLTTYFHLRIEKINKCRLTILIKWLLELLHFFLCLVSTWSIYAMHLGVIKCQWRRIT